ncbi:MAG: hypothetical protein J7619_00330 [Dyadobacter sp.]|uniref:hypothetical protein n=1 Tax=Dyadobacter sp. TaxID=1914288 RepID=UPI001B0627F8|nr:hypothetical protein [Dyadobacter sp.]MBO9611104.1 hypothetical protein [Dyadobacter sp.]
MPFIKRPHRFFKVFIVLATFLQVVYALLLVFNVYQVISASASDLLPGWWKSIVIIYPPGENPALKTA